MTVDLNAAIREHVEAISAADAVAEGVERADGDWRCYDELDPRANVRCLNARESYASLWDSLHTKDGDRWADNPWCYALTFTVVRGNNDQVPA